ARKIEVGERAFRILTKDAGFPPEDVILDPGVMAVATGLDAHRIYALAFIEAVAHLKRSCPGVRTSGGISNVSFAFRGQTHVREAMHAVFLDHAVRAGLDMGIVNAGALPRLDEIPPTLRDAVEDVLLDRQPDAADRLLSLAESFRGSASPKRPAPAPAWRTQPVEARLTHAMVHGTDEFLESDVAEARLALGGPVAVLEGPLMKGMDAVSVRFGAGTMFLPQVVKSARVMQKAVGFLQPFMESQSEGGKARPAARIVLATVKGDVHDIGKNIVSVVLRCNRCEVVDLGVMVPCEAILEAIRREDAFAVGLSGLITPSLEEMAAVAAGMEKAGLSIPLLVGGATTSRVHTAVKLAPLYRGPVLHVPDASRTAGVLHALLGPKRESFIAAERAAQAAERETHALRAAPILPIAEARRRRASFVEPSPRPARPGRTTLADFPLAKLAARIDWAEFLGAWEMKGAFPAILDEPARGAEARKLHDDALAMLDRLLRERRIAAKAVVGLFPSNAAGDDIEIYADESRAKTLAVFRCLRQQLDRPGGTCACLADFVAPRESAGPDWIGAFALTAGLGLSDFVRVLESGGDEYGALLARTLADRLAEAFAGLLHERVRRELWGYAPDEAVRGLPARGIRPAFGYPSCPDHAEKRTLFALLDAESEIGATLTESCMMIPAASVCGLYLANPAARLFGLGRIGRDQAEDYAKRQGIPLAEATKRLSPHLFSSTIPIRRMAGGEKRP
ncbi:MAG: vitamin B12 dependent-methionine synthase activation domain-containing protein, partial [Planctomycetota bacterium]